MNQTPQPPLIAQFPATYCQGSGVLSQFPAMLASLGLDRALVLAGLRAWESASGTLSKVPGITWVPFSGECTELEIQRVTEVMLRERHGSIVGLGGGKVIDTARAAAHRAGRLPFLSAPTVASTDAPTSATSVVYHADGSFSHYLRTRNPAAVVVDTAVIARAPLRYLVAGMGDALSTWFEAEACRRSNAANVCGGLPTLAAGAIARRCLETLYADGVEAAAACRRREVTPALERIVEANTLLSGIGFESGGLASAHAVHNGLTRIPACHHALHGEKVAFGVLVGLVFTGAPTSQMHEVLRFCLSVGLPTCFADLGAPATTGDELRLAAEGACASGESIYNEGIPVDPVQVADALRTADQIGRDFARGTTGLGPAPKAART